MASSRMTNVSWHTRSALDDVNTAYEADPAFRHLRATSRFVPGVGSLEPRAIFIGEAPGVNEDRVGEPFVGASGRLLNDLMHAIGLTRANCYITNVVKYRPPDNRTPTEEEIDAARPHLRAELGAFEDRPPVVLLGRVALHLVDENTAISRAHGVPIRRGPWTFLPVYHPAAALRNGALRKVMADEFLSLRRMLPHG
jgi:uracil-DNA glycosylase